MKNDVIATRCILRNKKIQDSQLAFNSCEAWIAWYRSYLGGGKALVRGYRLEYCNTGSLWFYNSKITCGIQSV